VLDGFSGVVLALQQDGVVTSRSSQSQLIQGQGLTTVLDDSSLSRAGELQSSDGQLWEFQKTLIVSDGTNDNSNLVSASLHVRLDFGQGDWVAVGVGLEKTSEDDRVESRVGSARKESVQLFKTTDGQHWKMNRVSVNAWTHLDKQQEIWILAGRSSTDVLLNVVSLDINTLVE
jgi:hypothetical protein